MCCQGNGLTDLCVTFCAADVAPGALESGFLSLSGSSVTSGDILGLAVFLFLNRLPGGV